MAPSQLQKGKKNPPAKPSSIPKNKQNECRITGSSQHPQAPTSCPNPYVARSSKRFRFKEPQSNGREKAREGQPMQKETQSSDHKRLSRTWKDRQDMDDDRESPPSSHGSDESEHDNADHDFDSNTQIKWKVKPSQGNPLKLGFYPPTWQVFLQTAKLEMQLQAVLAHPIPESQDALNLTREVLDAMLWTYHEKKNKLERGYFPEYNADMCRLLCDDLFTFRTELKKVIISIAKRAYDIFPQGSAMRKEEVQKQVTAAATRLLKSGDYLRLPDSSGGQFKNFMAQALKGACLEFYYSNSKKALKNTDKFRHTIPVNAMLLVAVVLKGVISGFRETSTDKVPDLTAEQPVGVTSITCTRTRRYTHTRTAGTPMGGTPAGAY
ncbi:uncharacterized protein EDB91DRAFT_1255156 [Suillus paluster]|uniref:uncharacterized protein n=1 Tax=Suillus paluster TaxID=48578 RepID=UPI001B8730C9|nr:uncharacterized protein EDB91DRAFT_1255156 [Suillus paluster]KAG1724564.1 hypothetical protein EDB91DRAFT_1255156 [Suillus paluster]